MFVADIIREYALIAKLHTRSLKVTTPPRHWTTGTEKPILLLPGLNESFVFLEDLANKLNQLGHPIHVPTRYNSYWKVPILAEHFAQFIRSQNLTGFICLSHSKGGLVAKYLMDNYPDINKEIERSISLGTPYNGSLLGYVEFISPFELIPGGSASRIGLRISENNAKVVALHSKFDNHVLPQKNLLHPNGRNIKVDIVGHTRILVASETFNIVKKLI